MPTGARSAQPQSDGGARILCEEVAQLLGTINYEIVCDVGARVERRYLHESNAGDDEAGGRTGAEAG